MSRRELGHWRGGQASWDEGPQLAVRQLATGRHISSLVFLVLLGAATGGAQGGAGTDAAADGIRPPTAFPRAASHFFHSAPPPRFARSTGLRVYGWGRGRA